MWEDYFSVQIFFIILRETLESAIIISVLLSFLKQNFTSTDATTGQTYLTIDSLHYNHLRAQIWVGALSGLGICLCIGAIFIAIFYIIGNDIWSMAERIWEGIFSIVSALIISVMGLALLRINQLQTKWKWKLGKSLNNNSDVHANPDDDDDGFLTEVEHEPLSSEISHYYRLKLSFQRFSRHYALAVLPFITTLREGLEAVVFVGGIGVNQPASAFPLAIVCGGLLGGIIGVVMYRGGNRLSLQYFLILSSCFLYLVAAGLMSRGVWFLELEQFVQKCGQDTSESGSGPGSYDISNTVWHVNCCNGLTDGGWMLLNALVGWTNTATYGSVFSYLLFWGFVITLLKCKSHKEKHGYLPWIPIKYQLKSIKKKIAFDRIMIHDYIDQYHELHSNISIEDITVNDTNQDHSGLGIPSTQESETSNLISSAAAH